MRKRSWTIYDLTDIVERSFSYRQVLIGLKLREAGGNYEQVKKYISESALDISHFKGKGWNAGLRGIGRPRVLLENILNNKIPFQSFKLKKRLFQEGLKKEECEKCGWTQKTEDGYIPLELDHINGNRNDNRLENLRVLCPNCHSLTKEYRGRKLKKNK